MRWLALLALALLVLARGGLAPAAERVRYCDYPVYPPVSWSDGHEVRGLAPQVVKRVLGGLGYDVQVVVLGNWKRCLMDAAAGRVDVVLAYRTAQRDQGLAFAEAPVLREEVALFYNRHKPVRFQTLDDLSHYRGGLLFGESYGAGFDRFVASHDNIEYVSDSTQNFGKLIRQRIDFIPYERRTGRLLVERLPGGADIVDAPQPITVDYLRLAVSRHSPLQARLGEIDKALQRLQADGSLARWLDESERDYRAMLAAGAQR
ncbi:MULTISPECIES: ABC transporter substrate-binding protein [Pseudomonas]|uniref:substrate-binding periplasmic protein n=1 Tax=Pseudomonas TaxID=286 RepID=UPI0002A2B16E|nr:MULTISPECIES: transporter substrate-binding domain-containing protein [Pseudomonas]NTX92597.1 transporter substrate-binding domain-containing protein [Pseudomonas sp. UMA643]NTY17137.1 transporter substrate-binding domain-containing protein [Pseudomonas sp. UMC3103]NTY25690.1 transporter substrate-binding domain-containing protein [Pseudomonas sp. UMA603]NTY29657.1 transporter substrate-binding domain-containing protein [Pseudomonas sp. UMC3129]NTY54367.1 transporter substrate-binding domai